MPAKIEIYTQWGCGYCSRAKALFDRKGAVYSEYDTTLGGAKKAEMLVRVPGARTVPQILIDGAVIGGCDDLHALEAAGRLDGLLVG